MARSKVLLVEGVDDEQVIYHLCNHHQIKNQALFEVIAKGSYDKVRADLSVRHKQAGIEIIGVVVDADIDRASRWQSLCDALRAAGYVDIPEAPGLNGTILPSRGDLPRVGLWIMPDNLLNTGILEDFLLQLVQEDDPLLPHADAAVDAIPEQHRQFKPSYRSKARIHTWLAWREEPGVRLGSALNQRYLQPEHPLAERFVGWLRALFSA